MGKKISIDGGVYLDPNNDGSAGARYLNEFLYRIGLPKKAPTLGYMTKEDLKLGISKTFAKKLEITLENRKNQGHLAKNYRLWGYHRDENGKLKSKVEPIPMEEREETGRSS